MSSCTATVNVDTEFRVPPEALRDGEVTCRVIRTDCDIVGTWEEWVTFEARLLLRISIRCGELVSSFTKEVVFKETVWLDVDSWIEGCDVAAVCCRCVLQRGRVHCNLTAKVAFCLKRRWPRHCDVIYTCRKRCGRPDCRHCGQHWDCEPEPHDHRGDRHRPSCKPDPCQRCETC